MKAFQVGLWSIWLSGFVLIGLSLYATQRLPSLTDQIKKPKLNYKGFGDLVGPKITIFAAASPFTGSIGARQVLAVRSWLGLSSDITVVLFSQDPSVVSFAGAFGSRVLVEPNIDFTVVLILPYSDSRTWIILQFEEAMGHRHLPNKFPMFETGQDQNRNHIPAEMPYIHMGRAAAPENIPSIHPMENMLSSGVHYTSQWDSESRPNDYSSSSFRMEVPQVRAAVPGSSYNPFPHLPAAGDFYTAPENNIGPAHFSFYNRHTLDEVEGGLLNPPMGIGRGPFKRKSPGISVACERGSTSRFYSAGSSSSSSEFRLEKPNSDYQIYPSGPIGLPHYTGGNLSISSEDPSRNVRSRSRLDLEPNPRRTQLPSYSSHHYCSTTHLINHPGTMDLSNVSANAATHEWNHISVSPAARGRFLTSETSGLSHETNQFLPAGSTVEIGGHHHDSISSRNPVSTSQYLHGLPQSAREGHTNFSRRAIPTYRADLSYSPLGHEAVSSENGPQLLSENYSSRYSRTLAAGGWRNNYRSGRSRIAIERFQSLPNAVDANDRMGSEALLMVDRSSSYDSRSLFDQYREMRLDIDNMSYEELLALGERIGNVSTGLSEYMISKCLMEKTYCSLDQNQDNMCAICLEGYNKKDEVAAVKNCGHDYHVGCIKKWLSMKNACPICKAPALADSLKDG